MGSNPIRSTNLKKLKHFNSAGGKLRIPFRKLSMSTANRMNQSNIRRRHYGLRKALAAQATTVEPSSPSEASLSSAGWIGSDGDIGVYIRQESEKTLAAYRNQPNLVRQDANLEEDTARGGYAHRQLFELVQNSADALVGSGSGRILIRLTPTYLYCADEGRPIDADGVLALMFSHLSSKRGTAEIGRFGLGFKSVLSVTDTPEFFSRSGSFQFDRARVARRIQSVGVNAERRN